MSSRTKALLAIVAAALLWSTAGVAKILVRTFDPFTAAFFRFLIAFLVILPFFLKEQKREKTSFWQLLPLGLASTGNIAFFYLGLRTTTANAATIIYNAEPLVIALAAPRLIGETVTKTKLWGIILGLAGTTLIALLPVIEWGQPAISGDLTGNLFIFGAVVSWAIYTIGSRRAISVRRVTPLALSTASILTSCVVFAILAASQWKPSYSALLGKPANLLLFLHLGILVTVATYLLFQWAIKHSSATTASLGQYLQPVFAVLFNIVFLNEQLTPGFVLGSIVALAGMGIATGGPLMREIRHWKMLRGG